MSIVRIGSVVMHDDKLKMVIDEKLNHRGEQLVHLCLPNGTEKAWVKTGELEQGVHYSPLTCAAMVIKQLNAQEERANEREHSVE